MKTFKYTIIMLAVILGFSALPSHSSAKEQIAAVAYSGNVCENLPFVADQMIKKIDTVETKRVLKKETNKNDLLTVWKIEAENRATQRALADVDRASYMEILKGLADTQVQIDAVNSFSLRVDSSVKKVRATIDEAYATYERAVLQAREARLVDMSGLIENYRKNLNDEFVQSRSVCQKSLAYFGDSRVRKNLDAVRNQFEKDRLAKETLEKTIKSLAEARKETIAEAELEFTYEVRASEEALRSSFEASL